MQSKACCNQYVTYSKVLFCMNNLHMCWINTSEYLYKIKLFNLIFQPWCLFYTTLRVAYMQHTPDSSDVCSCFFFEDSMNCNTVHKECVVLRVIFNNINYY
jgi:hypothetical protein